MRILAESAEKVAMKYIMKAAEIAKHSTCFRSKCGSVIVKDDEIIGQGYNSPPGDKPLEKCLKDDLPKDFKSDKTCCIHAEERAVLDALLNRIRKPIMEPNFISLEQIFRGSRLYFARLDENGEIKYSGDPYCTICSKMVLDVGIDEFALYRREGICVYKTDEYNTLSFQYRED